MLDGNVLMLVHPSSGDNIFYKVREDKSVVLLDERKFRQCNTNCVKL